MNRLDKKYVVGAAILAVVCAVVVLRFRNAARSPTPRAVAEVSAPVEVADAPRALVAPDPSLPPQAPHDVAGVRSTFVVHGHVIDESSREAAPVVQVFGVLSGPDPKWLPVLQGILAVSNPGMNWGMQTLDSVIVGDVGTFRAEGLDAGEWDIGLLSSDGRVGAAHFRVGKAQPDATIEVRVGRRRSIIGRVISDPSVAASKSTWVSARPASDFSRFNALALMVSPSDSFVGKRVRVGADGMFRLDDAVPGSWMLNVEGPGDRAERTVIVTTREDSHVTLYMKPPEEPAMLQLTNLDSRFDGPLCVRLEREQEDPVEFVADPQNGREQTFPVAAGKSKLVVYAMYEARPDLDKLPITRRTLDVTAGETCVVALYPR